MKSSGTREHTCGQRRYVRQEATQVAVGQRQPVYMHRIKAGSRRGSTLTAGLTAVLGATVLGRQPRLAVATTEEAAKVAGVPGERRAPHGGSSWNCYGKSLAPSPEPAPPASVQVLTLWSEH